MRIYVVMPRTAANNAQAVQTQIQRTLIDALRKYYGPLNASAFQFYATNAEQRVDVYVMDKAKFPGHEDAIRQTIRDAVSLAFPALSDLQTDVKLNYGALNPNFQPGKESPKRAVEKKPSGNSTSETDGGAAKLKEFDYEKLAMNYQGEEPHYTFEQVILSQTTREQIEEAVGTIAVEAKVFDEWGLRSIIPHASSAMSFYGPPGTGKSMAAEAVASKLGKKILRATYADIESKYHGEGPKMVKAIFRAAERDDAVLFLDESDSLLSKRLTNVSDGSAQAINSMRSQLLICLEQFRGIVIFATNLVVNYDKAFLSRLINIEFTMPDVEAREAIWKIHLMGDGLRIPLSDDVDTHALAENFAFCGREIKSSVKDACVITAMNGWESVGQDTLLKSAEKVRIESAKVLQANDHTVSKKVEPTQAQREAIQEAIQNKLNASGQAKSLPERMEEDRNAEEAEKDSV